MKWFSLPTYKKHQEDVKCYTRGVGRYYSAVINLANQFNREYASIGILDINDLIQAGHVGLLQAWNNIQWDKIEASNEPDAQLWTFIKKRIKGAISREIDKYSTHIKIPRRKLEEMRSNLRWEDQIFCDLFPNFFDTSFPELSDEITPWDQIQMYEFLDDLMIKYLKPNEKLILELFYGLDGQNKMSWKQIAEYQKIKEGAIRKTKQRAIDKLKNNEEVINKIENYLAN